MATPAESLRREAWRFFGCGDGKDDSRLARGAYVPGIRQLDAESAARIYEALRGSVEDPPKPPSLSTADELAMLAVVAQCHDDYQQCQAPSLFGAVNGNDTPWGSIDGSAMEVDAGLGELAGAEERASGPGRDDESSCGRRISWGVSCASCDKAGMSRRICKRWINGPKMVLARDAAAVAEYCRVVEDIVATRPAQEHCRLTAVTAGDLDALYERFRGGDDDAGTHLPRWEDCLNPHVALAVDPTADTPLQSKVRLETILRHGERTRSAACHAVEGDGRTIVVINAAEEDGEPTDPASLAYRMTVIPVHSPPHGADEGRPTTMHVTHAARPSFLTTMGCRSLPRGWQDLTLDSSRYRELGWRCIVSSRTLGLCGDARVGVDGDEAQEHEAGPLAAAATGAAYDDEGLPTLAGCWVDGNVDYTLNRVQANLLYQNSKMHALARRQRWRDGDIVTHESWYGTRAAMAKHSLEWQWTWLGMFMCQIKMVRAVKPIVCDLRTSPRASASPADDPWVTTAPKSSPELLWPDGLRGNLQAYLRRGQKWTTSTVDRLLDLLMMTRSVGGIRTAIGVMRAAESRRAKEEPAQQQQPHRVPAASGDAAARATTRAVPDRPPGSTCELRLVELLGLADTEDRLAAVSLMMQQEKASGWLLGLRRRLHQALIFMAHISHKAMTGRQRADPAFVKRMDMVGNFSEATARNDRVTGKNIMRLCQGHLGLIAFMHSETPNGKATATLLRALGEDEAQRLGIGLADEWTRPLCSIGTEIIQATIRNEEMSLRLQKLVLAVEEGKTTDMEKLLVPWVGTGCPCEPEDSPPPST